MAKFKSVSSQVDFPSLEREILKYWQENGIVKKYLHRNDSSDKKFSFLDGPITANNPMGVHHAWGRTYKDLWQRFYNMCGYKQRFQNGYDEQGLWVEVEVEKELGLKSKKDIENIVPGDKFKSLEKFVNLCKERVQKYSTVITDQSKRLAYFMDWDNSYHTSSNENNYAIWNFLKIVNEKGWLYKGEDSVPWCPRCGTAISQHEISTEEYKQLTHASIYFRLPVKGKKGVYLLVWTTTPWTIPANVAVAVDKKLTYVEVENEGESYILVEDKVASIFPEGKKKASFMGMDLEGWEYEGPFDDLPGVQKKLAGYIHRVVISDPLILPISIEEGTGLVHIAPGCGSEDFSLGQKEKLPAIGPLDESGIITSGFGDFSGKNTKEVAPLVINELQKTGFIFKTEDYSHRYPTCWRCKTELVWRVVEEWYIAVDRKNNSGKTYREQMMEVAKKINWHPEWGLERELDWLKNMHDWLISKKRYWGLSLPIWECKKCGNFEVIGSEEELKASAIEGWDKFEGHTPHRPWVDQIKIKCVKCGEIIERIPDVGNPWLDAGIVPFSTMPKEWFPADFVTEAFPGQFKNWFYSLIAMSTALAGENPYRNLLGHGLVHDEKGEEMHKSKGNSIEFNEAADKIGVDVMRWVYALQNPENNLNFGYKLTDEVRRKFYLILWNSYKFFVDYATLSNWENTRGGNNNSQFVLDRWIVARLNQVIEQITASLKKYDATSASHTIENFIVNDFSTWYIRRSRDRVGPGADEKNEKVFLGVAYEVLLSLSKLLAPFMPFIAEEIFRNLTGEESVHLSDYPEGNKSEIDGKLMEDMGRVRQLVELGHAKRKDAGIKLRQPLAGFTYSLPEKLSEELEQIMADELNVKNIEYRKSSGGEPSGELNTNITQELKVEGEVRELIRNIQKIRKEKGLTLKDRIIVSTPNLPADKKFIDLIVRQTNAVEIKAAGELAVEVV